jgi:crotonobetainyl-CoA:carnitine CoA-transferase CaiB-like acyl-CoA transferase
VHRSLDDLLVLDLSWAWSGPAVGVALAELGATVLKIESGTRSDNTRLRGTPVDVELPPGVDPRDAVPYFHALNRGKRSVTLDLRTEAGRSVLQDLAAQADVIVENLTEGVMARFGIAPEQVLARNPDCVFLSLRGFRDHPTTRGLRAYAPTLTSNAGLEALVGYPGEEPVGLTTVAYSDGFAAGQGLLHVLAGLLARGDHGGGAAIEVSQHEACVLANGHNLVACQLGEKPALDAVDGVEVTRAEDLPRSGWVSDDLYTEVVADGLPPMELARLPWRVGGSLPAPTAAGPRLGAHTGDELRRRLAYPAARVRGLARSGALT